MGRSLRLRILVGLLVATIGLAGYLGYTRYGQYGPKAIGRTTLDTSLDVDAVVATVNGEPIHESEILAELQTNPAISRNDAINNYVNRIVVASLTDPANAQAAIRLATRQALFNIALTNLQTIESAKITATDVQSYYDRNVQEAAFNQYQVSYYLTQDQTDANERLLEFSRGKVEKMKLVENKTGNWIALQDLPYGTGQLVASLEKGQMTPTPLIVRDGLLILRLNDIKKGIKPSVKDLTPQIRTALLQARLTAAVAERRKAADIRIK